MSVHAIEIIQVGPVEKHPNPEVTRMEFTRVWGWQCVVGKDQFHEGDHAVYIPPDYLVPLDRPEFAFLKKPGDTKQKERIRVRRFKGTLSQGLLIPVPPALAGMSVGMNVIDALDIERYEPPLPMSTGGLFVSGPSGLYAPKFDVENYQRYKHLLTEGEPVIVTEKLHGANTRYCFTQNKDGIMEQFCGSRTNWMARDEKNIWWRAFDQRPAIGEWCKTNPGKLLYGEVFGQVQSLKYGAGKNDCFFAAFALLDQNRWVDWQELLQSVSAVSGLATAPFLHSGPFNEKQVMELAEGDSAWPNAKHMREGVVIVPIQERVSDEIGRVCLKVVSNRYLETG